MAEADDKHRDSARLALFDAPASACYVPPALRRFWNLLLVPATAVIIFAGWPPAAKILLAAAWAAPSLVYYGILTVKEDVLLRSRLRAAKLLRERPPPTASLREQLTRLLQATCMELEAQDSDNHELRLTVFRPDPEFQRLTQVARYEWNDSTEVSDTDFAFDEGLVGVSYASKEDVAIPDIRALSDRRIVVGLMKHKKKKMQSLLVKAITNNAGECVTVLSIDSTTPNFFDPKQRSLDSIADLAAAIEQLIALVED